MTWERVKELLDAGDIERAIEAAREAVKTSMGGGTTAADELARECLSRLHPILRRTLGKKRS